MRNDNDFEKFLERISPKPAPPGLREKTLRAARENAAARQVISPAFGWTLACFSLLLLFFLLADRRISSAEGSHLDSLLNLPVTKIISPEQSADQRAAEFLAALPDLNGTLRQIVRQAFLIEERAVRRSKRAPQLLMEGINEN